MNEPVRRRWDGSGGSRSLMGLIAEARPDQVLVRSVSSDAVSTALRTGLPVLETGTAKADGATSVAAPPVDPMP